MKNKSDKAKKYFIMLCINILLIFGFQILTVLFKSFYSKFIFICPFKNPVDWDCAWYYFIQYIAWLITYIILYIILNILIYKKLVSDR